MLNTTLTQQTRFHRHEERPDGHSARRISEEPGVHACPKRNKIFRSKPLNDPNATDHSRIKVCDEISYKRYFKIKSNPNNLIILTRK